jgi:sRNA-binding carbon storage regulator CsrA
MSRGNKGGLCLTRRKGQGFVIVVEGKVIEITYIKPSRGGVQIRIVAPPEVSISRTEILERANEATED